MPYPALAFACKSRNTAQRGFTLVELLVGVIIGLLVVAVALGAMMGSRAVSGSTGDLSQMQQQAAYAFRVIARQIRQSSSLHLMESPFQPDAGEVAYPPFLFEANNGNFNLERSLAGQDNPASGHYKLTLRSREYKVPTGSRIEIRDCLGESGSNKQLESNFVLEEHELKCRSGNNQKQALIHNVADFQVRYLTQPPRNDGGKPLLHYSDARSIDAGLHHATWRDVTGIEICLVLFGTERMDASVPEDNRKYTGCIPAVGGAEPQVIDVDSLDGVRKNRQHMSFRAVFQRRSRINIF